MLTNRMMQNWKL